VSAVDVQGQLGRIYLMRVVDMRVQDRNEGCCNTVVTACSPQWVFSMPHSERQHTLLDGHGKQSSSKCN
jgi:hypothetical protein